MRLALILTLSLGIAGAASAQARPIGAPTLPRTGYAGYRGYEAPKAPRAFKEAPAAKSFEPFRPAKPFKGVNVYTAPSGLYPELYPKRKKHSGGAEGGPF